MHQDNKKISIVLTIYGDDGNLLEILSCINQQTKLPDEVIIINSLHSDKVEQSIQLFKHLEIKYFLFNERLMPGGARNEGVNKSAHSYIAFLDSKTLPEQTWLEHSLNQVINSNKIFIYGLTQYVAKSEMEEIFLLSSFGKKPVLSIPGMLIHRDLFSKIGEFNSFLRAGEDLEWRMRVDQDNSVMGLLPKHFNLRYESISGNIFSQFYRSARNNWSAASIDAQLNTRALFLALVSSFLLLITPNWNRFLGGIFFIPNITKIYFIFFSISVILVYLIRPKKIRVLTQNFFLPMLFTFLILTIAFPEALQMAATHTIGEKFLISIGPFFITSLLTIGFIFRAFIAPIRLGANLNDLFPLRWILMGSLGLVNDLFKAPGYLLGACLTVGRIFKRKTYDSF